MLTEHVPKPLVEVGQRKPKLGRAGSGLDEAGRLQATVQRVDHMRVQVADQEVAFENGHHSDQGGSILLAERVGCHASLRHACSVGRRPRRGKALTLTVLSRAQAGNTP